MERQNVAFYGSILILKTCKNCITRDQEDMKSEQKTVNELSLYFAREFFCFELAPKWIEKQFVSIMETWVLLPNIKFSFCVTTKNVYIIFLIYKYISLILHIFCIFFAYTFKYTSQTIPLIHFLLSLLCWTLTHFRSKFSNQ